MTKGHLIRLHFARVNSRVAKSNGSFFEGQNVTLQSVHTRTDMIIKPLHTRMRARVCV